MNDNVRELISNATIDMYESLRKSVEQAGGAFDKDIFMNMTVDKLISLLCTNNVRFVYKYFNQNKANDELKQENDNLRKNCQYFTDQITDLRKKYSILLSDTMYKEPGAKLIQENDNLRKKCEYFEKELQYLKRKHTELIFSFKEYHSDKPEKNSYTELAQKYDDLKMRYDKLRKHNFRINQLKTSIGHNETEYNANILNYVKMLVKYMHKRYYSNNLEFELADTTIGLLSQLDNMISGLENDHGELKNYGR